MSHRRTALIIGTFILVVAVVGIGVTVTTRGGSRSSGMMRSKNIGGSMSSYYRSMMSSYEGNSMMGGGSTGVISYGWMIGGTGAPGWMRGGTLPASMMGVSTDAGEVIGRLFANAPGSRVTSTEATRLGDDVPIGATVDRSYERITLSGSSDHLVVLASPSGSPDETFRIAGMVNPTITVNPGARISIEVVNADPDAAHGLVVTADSSASSRMPMLTAAPAFSGSELWFLGNPTSAGMHIGTLTFTANKSGTYQYLCPVPDHARDGMVGAFVVTS
jgi:rusticyanin